MIPLTYYCNSSMLLNVICMTLSLYAATNNKECSEDDVNNDSNNNNLLSYHWNRIVHVQHMVW